MMETSLTDPNVLGSLAALMRLLGDATRLRILGLLQVQEQNVTALCGQLDLAQPTVSHHLGLLRSAGLLLARRDGKQIHYSLNPQHLTTMVEDGSLHLAIGQVRMCLGCKATAPASGAAS